MLCHVGVKHKFINQVLALNGYPKIALGVSEAVAAVKIKTEKQANVTMTRSAQKAKKAAKPQEKTETPKARQTRNSKDIQEVRFCEICDRELANVSQLANHMIGSHLLRDIKDKFSAMYNGKECTECMKPFNKNSVWQHLGSVHNKLDEILISKGYRPLKTIVTPSMRKVVVKRERMDEDTSTTETPDYQLPNLFESVLASGDQEQETNDYDANMMAASDPLSN